MKREEINIIMRREEINIIMKKEESLIMKREGRKKNGERKCRIECSDQIVSIVNQLFCHY